MGLHGPYTAVANTLQSCQVDPDAGAVYVRNTSRFDLALSLQASQPVTTINYGGAPWDVVIPAGDRVGVNLALGRYPNGFTGLLWVLPIDNSGSLALSGTKSGNNNFYLEGYPAVALLPPDYASAQFSNLASQPRVITIPVVPHIVFGFAAQPLAANNFTQKITAPSLASFSPVLSSMLTVQVYFYRAILTVIGVRRIVVSFSVNAYDSGGGLLAGGGGSNIYIPLFAGMPTPYTPFSALPWSVVAPVNTQTLKLMILSADSWPASSGSNALLYGEAEFDIDLTGQSAPPAIGNGIATPPGAIY